MVLKAIKQVHDADVLVRKRVWHTKGKSGKWSEWQDLLKRSELVVPEISIARRTRSQTQQPQPRQQQPVSKSFHLPLGGTFTIYPNLLSLERQEDVTNELMDHSNLFRQYRIQGGPEPRAHFLLHSQATNEDFDSSLQPGYKYGTISMKARPLSLLPRVEQLADELLETCGVEDWNVGINPVFYRDARDYIGLHADNDQGEDCILTVLVKSPTTPRGVIIQTSHANSKSKAKRDGDEQYLLLVGAGDAYSMDGIMQLYYVHGVPSSLGDEQNGRIALVLRHGMFARYIRDSGQALDNVEPRIVIERSFGRIQGLVEGDSYSRAELRELGAHLSPQGGISGNKTDGCDAIIVTDARKDGLGEDRFNKLMYAAETRVGAASILTSMRTSQCIRVFRSSAADDNVYRALEVEKGPTQYRYDGLYRVSCVLYFAEHGIEKMELPGNVSPPVAGRVYQFQLERVNVGEDAVTNEKSTEQLMEYSTGTNTVGRDARAARMQHDLLPWPMSIVVPRQSTANEDGMPDLMEHHIASSTLRFGDVFGDADGGEGLSQYYSEFPTPVFEEQSRLVSPPQTDCSASSYKSDSTLSPETVSSDVMEAVESLMHMFHHDTREPVGQMFETRRDGTLQGPTALEDEFTRPAMFQLKEGQSMDGSYNGAPANPSMAAPVARDVEVSTAFESRQDTGPFREPQNAFLSCATKRDDFVLTEERLEWKIARKRARLNHLLSETPATWTAPAESRSVPRHCQSDGTQALLYDSFVRQTLQSSPCAVDPRFNARQRREDTITPFVTQEGVRRVGDEVVALRSQRRKDNEYQSY